MENDHPNDPTMNCHCDGDCGENCQCQEACACEEGCGCHDDMPTTTVKARKANTSGVAEDGNMVLVHYTGKLDDGEVFDSSEGRDPISFIIGEHRVIKGFESAITGMKVGEKKDIVIESSEAYGDVNPELVQEIPREALGDIVPEEGMMLALQHPATPQPIPVRVVKVSPEVITIDMNHPLAGKRLHFTLELAEIQ